MENRSILVTGVPRSGTTWTARLLAGAPGTALAGREPMNPRGRQYALAHTVTGWARLTDVTPTQRRALTLAYRGLNPYVYSRYGRHQWRAPLPWTRMIVKDPFALLSLPVVHRSVRPKTVLVFRHPGAVLASYRRMGWQPDLDELRPIVDRVRFECPDDEFIPPELPRPGEMDPAVEMGIFWSALHAIALRDAGHLPDVTVVSHEELAVGGVPAARTLCSSLGLTWSRRIADEFAPDHRPRTSGSAAPAAKLHNFDRAPRDAATSWRSRMTAVEVELVESTTDAIHQRLKSMRLPLVHDFVDGASDERKAQLERHPEDIADSSST